MRCQIGQYGVEGIQAFGIFIGNFNTELFFNRQQDIQVVERIDTRIAKELIVAQGAGIKAGNSLFDDGAQF